MKLELKNSKEARKVRALRKAYRHTLWWDQMTKSTEFDYYLYCKCSGTHMPQTKEGREFWKSSFGAYKALAGTSHRPYHTGVVRYDKRKKK